MDDTIPDSEPREAPGKLPEIPGYTFLKQLGAGGLGVVLHARTSQGQDVAIKLLTNLSEQSRSRFQRELEVGLSIQHPHLVRTLAGGYAEGLPYLVLEYLTGQSLARILHREGLPSPDKALEILYQVADGLDYLHSQGFVHRDLKPENVQLLADGTVRIIDLGLLQAAERTRLTKTGAILGTFLYMAPEQMQGKEGTAQVDLFALAILAYKLLTLKNPFYSGDTIQLNEYIPLLLSADPKPWNPKNPAGPVDRFFRQALESQPERRFPHATLLVQRLHQALHEEGAAITPPPKMLRPLDSSAESHTIALDESVQNLSLAAPKVAPPEESPPPRSGAFAPQNSAPLSSPSPSNRLPLLALALALFAIGSGLAFFWPTAPTPIVSIDPLTISPKHRLVVLKTLTACQFEYLGGSPVLSRKNGTVHLVGVPFSQDSLRLFENGVELSPRALPPQDWKLFTWSKDNPFDLTPEEQQSLWPTQGRLPTSDSLISNLGKRLLNLDILSWIDEVQQKQVPLTRVIDTLQKEGIPPLYQHTKLLLLESLADLPTLKPNEASRWIAAHALVLIDQYLRRNGQVSPLTAEEDGLFDLLFELETYPPGERPPPTPNRVALQKYKDLFLAEFPDQRQSDTFSSIFFQAKRTFSIAIPPGKGVLHADVFITQSERFSAEFFGYLKVNDISPLFFFEPDPLKLIEIWKDTHGTDKEIRRRYRIRLPDFLARSDLRLEPHFKVWRYQKNRPYDNVPMQAIGLSR